jgi:hypothetical protein
MWRLYARATGCASRKNPENKNTSSGREAIHRNGDITSHYSSPEIAEPLGAANRVCETNPVKIPSLTVLKRKTA